jgi:hypothetical protein
MRPTKVQIYSKVVQAIMTNTGNNIDNFPGEASIDKIKNLATLVTDELQGFSESCSDDFFEVALGFFLGSLANENANESLRFENPKLIKAAMKDVFNRTTTLMKDFK